jgi:hypothetical protein
MLLWSTIGLWFFSLFCFGFVYGGVRRIDRKLALIGLLFPIVMLYYGAIHYKNVKYSYPLWILSTIGACLTSILLLAD